MFGRQLVGFTLFLALTAPASARIEQWTATGSGADVTVADCSECEEDQGVLLICQGAGRPAKLYVPFLAQDEPPIKPNERRRLPPMVFTTDGQQFSYGVLIDHWGLVGFVPYINLDAGDPLVGALQNGRYLDVSALDSSIQFPLTGARAALETFKQNCPWGGNSQPQLGQPQLGQPQIAQPQLGQPQIAQPQIARPQLGPPQIAQPQLGQPQLGQPQLAQPQIAQPQLAQPQIAQPQLSQPQLGQPQIGQPQIAQPQVVQPQLAQPVRLPFETRSGGGKVRGGPSLEAGQVGSTREMDPVTLLEEVPNSMMNGYPWFRIRYSGGEGYQWGGIICRPAGVSLAGTYGECTR
jgi:hypothetical protein